MLKILNSVILTMFCLSFLMMMISNHPMTLGIMVIFQCICLSTILTEKFSFSWFSFFIFIIFLGGILMLFSYIISITFSKEPMLKNMSKKILMMIFICMNYMFFLKKEETTTDFLKMKFQNMIQSTFSNSEKLSLFLLTFLLIIMIMVVFMTESSKGNMRTI
uniref:NADH dehydrogenase subunit 6 n=1 Tax=Ctenothrips transeolineae TaxID=3045420 RepID=UPI0030E40F2F